MSIAVDRKKLLRALMLPQFPPAVNRNPTFIPDPDNSFTEDPNNPLFDDPDPTLIPHWIGATVYWKGKFYHFCIVKVSGGAMTGDIRLATSEDLTESWDWQGIIYTPPSPRKVEAHHVVRWRNKWFMSTARSPTGDTPWKTGMLESTDLLNWTNDVEIIDLGPSGAWDDFYASDGRVIVWKGKLYVYYIGGQSTTDRRVGLATSTDGITFTKHPSNPIIPLGPAGSWDDERCILQEVYSFGHCVIATVDGYDGATWRKFYAISEDGVNFTKIYQELQPFDVCWNLMAVGPDLVTIMSMPDSSGWGRAYIQDFF